MAVTFGVVDSEMAASDFRPILVCSSAESLDMSALVSSVNCSSSLDTSSSSDDFFKLIADKSVTSLSSRSSAVEKRREELSLLSGATVPAAAAPSVESDFSACASTRSKREDIFARSMVLFDFSSRVMLDVMLWSSSSLVSSSI